MHTIARISYPAVLALFVAVAHPQEVSQTPLEAKSTRPGAELSRQERNQQSTFDPQRISDAELKKNVTELNKASSFTKMTVQNMQNEKLGTVSDLVFDPESGRISYAVLSVGGFLGVGEKLVAVPLTSLRPQPGQNYLVLNMTKDEARSAPGLAKNNWPKLNDPSLGSPASSETSSSSGSSATSSSDAASSSDQPDTSKSSDKLSTSPSAPTGYNSSASDKSKSSASDGKDAQGSDPSNAATSSSSTTTTENSGKDSGSSSPQP
jgi:sporulation protein YlmC with PRC-barrel domain